jgi:hypothetical protein
MKSLLCRSLVCLAAAVSNASAQTYLFSRAELTAGATSMAVAAADFNKDGKIDLAVANAGDNTVSVLLENRDATFRTQVSYATAGAAFVATGDFNGDGKADLAALGNGNVSVLLGNGDGTFQPFIAFPVPNAGALSGQMITGDFNGDGKVDLATSNGSAKSVSVLLGNGDGAFQAHVDYGTNTAAEWVTAGDYNGDGKLDLAVSVATPPNGTGQVVVRLGNGDGTFQNPKTDTTNSFASPLGIAQADFNRDGFLDLAIAHSDGKVVLLLGKGDGTFLASPAIATGSLIAFSAATSDLNADGKLDLVVVLGTASNNVAVLLGNGDGTFQAATLVNANGFPRLAIVNDFNGDRKPDLAVANSNCSFGACPPGSVSILLGDGHGGFGAARADLTTDTDPLYLALADFNGDAKLDMVVSTQVNNDVNVFLGNGNGTFQNFTKYAVGVGPGFVLATDLNGDGRPDLAVVAGCANDPNCQHGSAVSILLGKGDGTFSTSVQYPTGKFPNSIVWGDFNGDGKVDIATSNYVDGFSSNVSVLLGNGDGTFQPQKVIAIPNGLGLLVAGDFNRDGKPDLAVAERNQDHIPGFVAILLGNGDGTFQSPMTFPTGQTPYGLVAADFNGDGILDLATANGNPFNISVLLGNGDGTFQTHVDYADPTVSSPHFLSVADLNGDGETDLIVGDISGVFVIFYGNGDGSFQPGFAYSGAGGIVFTAAGDLNGDSAPDIVATAPNTNLVSVYLSLPVAALFPSTTNFGTQTVGTTSNPRRVTLSNSGAAPLVISRIRISGPNAADFAQTNNCGATLAPGTSCSLKVTFTPTATGSRSAFVTFTDNATGGTQRVTLKGTGI